MSTGIIVGAVILILVVLWALHPLWEARKARQRLAETTGDHTLENLLFERESLLVALRDLRMDHEMGKLNDEDFAALDAQYRERAVVVLKQLDLLGVPDVEDSSEGSLDAWIEAAVARARERHAPAQENAAEAATL